MLNKERQRCTAISVREQRSKGQKRKKVRQFTFYKSIVNCQMFGTIQRCAGPDTTNSKTVGS